MEDQKRSAYWKAVIMRIVLPLANDVNSKASSSTYEAKALAADDLALQVILLDPRSGSSEGK